MKDQPIVLRIILLILSVLYIISLVALFRADGFFEKFISFDFVAWVAWISLDFIFIFFACFFWLLFGNEPKNSMLAYLRKSLRQLFLFDFETKNEVRLMAGITFAMAMFLLISMAKQHDEDVAHYKEIIAQLESKCENTEQHEP